MWATVTSFRCGDLTCNSQQHGQDSRCQDWLFLIGHSQVVWFICLWGSQIIQKTPKANGGGKRERVLSKHTVKGCHRFVLINRIDWRERALDTVAKTLISIFWSTFPNSCEVSGFLALNQAKNKKKSCYSY